MNQTLAELERAAYISGDTKSAELFALADDAPKDHDLLKDFYELCAESAGFSLAVTPENVALLADEVQALFRRRVADNVP